MLFWCWAGVSLRSMKPTRRPVRPPTRPSAPDTPFAALEMAGPAAAVTRDKLCVAFAVASDTVDEALETVCLAVSAAFVVVVVDSKRTMVRPTERPDRLMTRANDILVVWLVGGRLGRGEGKRDHCQSVGWNDRKEKKIELGRAARRTAGARPRSDCGRRPSGRSWVQRTISRTVGRDGPEVEKNWKARKKRRWWLPGFSACGRPISRLNWRAGRQVSELPVLFCVIYGIFHPIGQVHVHVPLVYFHGKSTLGSSDHWISLFEHPPSFMEFYHCIKRTNRQQHNLNHPCTVRNSYFGNLRYSHHLKISNCLVPKVRPVRKARSEYYPSSMT